MLDDIYNAFEHPRWERPSLPLLGPDEARRYMDDVRAKSLDVLDVAAGVAAEVGGAHDDCGSARRRIGQADQATDRVMSPMRMDSLIGNRHGFPFRKTPTPRLVRAGHQPSEAIAKIIDHMNPDGRTT